MTTTKAMPTAQSQAIGLLHDIAALYDDLLKFSKPLTLPQAEALIDKYGYDNTVSRVVRLANRNAAESNYKSVYLTLDNWLRDDLKNGKIKKPLTYEPVPANEVNGCPFLKQFPVGSTIESTAGNKFVVNKNMISSIEGSGAAILIANIKKAHPNGIFPFHISKQI